MPTTAETAKSDGSAFDTFDNALFVLTTVMSRPNDERAVVDAGHKSAAVDSGPPEPFGCRAWSIAVPATSMACWCPREVDCRNAATRCCWCPGHCDPTVNLHEWYVCVRGLHGAAPHVEAVWPISARGAVF